MKNFFIFLYFWSVIAPTGKAAQSELLRTFLSCNSEEIEEILYSGAQFEQVDLALERMNLHIEVLQQQYQERIMHPMRNCEVEELNRHLRVEQEKIDVIMRPVYHYLSDEEYADISVDLYLQAGVQYRLPEHLYQPMSVDEPIHRCLRSRQIIRAWIFERARQDQ